jgi:exodeoxyribonuclease VIII
MKRFEMNEQELTRLIKAAATPGVFQGGLLDGYNPAEVASNKEWETLGKKYGFDHSTVAPGSESEHEPRIFYAQPVDLPFLNVMVDLETLGTKPGCQILSIGAVAFGANGLGQEFYSPINLGSQEALGLTTNQATIDWWKSQSPAAQKVLIDAQTCPQGLEEVLKLFNAWLGGVASYNATHADGRSEKIAIWGNGSDFDNMILAEAYSMAGIELPWKFYMNRCFRTLKNLFPQIREERTGVHHNALDDARYQAGLAVRMLGQL